MAQPTNPLIVWAEDNANLPATGQPNKSAPQEALRKMGWDRGQKPSCEEFNYILNNLAQYINYYGVEKTAEILSKTVSAGDGLTGGGALSSNPSLSLGTPSTVGGGSQNSVSGQTHTHSLSLTNDNIAILVGVISNGATIPLPSGFTEQQCRWMVSVNDDNANNTQWDIAELNLISTPYRLQCSTSGRVVTIKSTVFADSGAGNTGSYVVHNGTANYIIIGVK